MVFYCEESLIDMYTCRYAACECVHISSGFGSMRANLMYVYGCFSSCVCVHLYICVCMYVFLGILWGLYFGSVSWVLCYTWDWPWVCTTNIEHSRSSHCVAHIHMWNEDCQASKLIAFPVQSFCWVHYILSTWFPSWENKLACWELNTHA